MVWAAATMAFFGFLRVGEMTVPRGQFEKSYHLGQGDVQVSSHENPEHLVVRIKASKTGPFRQVISVYLGRTYIELFPVVVVWCLMVQRGNMESSLNDSWRSEKGSVDTGV